jgi:hypothetical protein
MDFDPIGGRRFLMTMGCGIVCTVLVWFGKIDGNIFRDVVIATVAVYIAGNVIQKHVQAARGGYHGTST